MTGIKRMVVLAVGLALASAGLAMAGQRQADRLSDQQLKQLVNRIDTHGKAFHKSFQRAIDRSPIDGRAAEDQINRFVKDFEQAVNALRDRVNDRQSSTADADNVLRRASFIDDFIMSNQLDPRAQGDWQALRLDMNDLARGYGLTWNRGAASQSLPFRVDDRHVEQLLKQIGENVNRFDKSLDRAFDRSGSDDRRAQDEIRQSVKDFEHATDRLRDRANGRQSSTIDVENVLRGGSRIDGFMQRYQLSAQAEQNWVSVRGDLDRLARVYNVAWNWSHPGYTPSWSGASVDHRLTGTYQHEPNQGDDPRRAAERAASAASFAHRQPTYQNLLARLEAPELLAIERHGTSVTMASTRGGRVTFAADGRDRIERWSGEQNMRTRATLDGERLVVATTGSRGSDFTVTFEAMEDGRSLQMTRTIDDEALRQPVTVRSVYRRLSDEARWDVDVDAPRYPGDRTGYPSRDLVVPEGTRFVALLDTALSSTNAREGDVYTLTVGSPSQYEGAVIQGAVSNVNESGRLNGRPGMLLTLRSIRLRNGDSYLFDGVIDDIRTPDGQVVRVDREGTVDSDDDQTRAAVERGAIGAALGAIIGAVAGGGKGAAIGAVIGAGAGAGTIFIEGRDRLDLPRGTEFTIISGDRSNQRTISDEPR